MESQWQCRSEIQADELISIWLLRAAREAGSNAYQLTTQALGDDVLWCRDFDLAISNVSIDRLARFTGADGQRLIEARLLPPLSARRSTTAGVLAYGVRHRTRVTHGLQYCSLCLLEDRTPYFRREWRLSAQFGCWKHAVLLRDACPHCDAPVAPHRDPELIFCRCAECGTSLCRESSPLSVRGTVASRLVHDLFMGRTLSYGEHEVDWVGLPGIVDCLFCFLKSTYAHDRLIKKLAQGAEVARPAAPTMGLEKTRVGLRAEILSLIPGLFGSTPSAFYELCQSFGITRRGIVGFRSTVLPGWFASLLEGLPQAPIRRRRRPTPAVSTVVEDFKTAFAQIDLESHFGKAISRRTAS